VLNGDDVSLTEAMILEGVVVENALGLIMQLNRDAIGGKLVVKTMLRVLLENATRRGTLLNIRRSCWW
jgi:hypothetical protein